ncbi:MAG: M48 family metallopeptidase [Candidatus Bruticola sp.]
MNHSTIVISDLVVKVVRRHRKRSVLRIKPVSGEICISASPELSDNQLRSFVESRLGWIRAQRLRCQDMAPIFIADADNPKESFCFIWGRRYTIKVVCQSLVNRVSVPEKDFVLAETTQKNYSVERLQAMLNKFLRQELQIKLDEAIKKGQQITGLTVNEYHIKKMVTKWGTCNPAKKRIWISTMLVHRDLECLQYVVLHELTHLLESHHNSIFYKYMEQFCPNWRLIKERLKEPLNTGCIL